jgi:hypothetical protein
LLLLVAAVAVVAPERLDRLLVVVLAVFARVH